MPRRYILQNEIVEVFFMKYRCPHCGQVGFSFLAKTDLVPRLRFVPEYAQGVRCTVCRERAVYYARWGGRVGHWLGNLILGLVFIGGLLLLVNAVPKETINNSGPWGAFVFIFLPIALWAALLVGFKWLFCYLDKPAQADYISANHFRFTLPATVRLWPRVRVGEIYLFRFPKRKRREDGPYLIGMVTNVEKDGDSQEVTVRVVKEYLMDAPLVDEELVLATEGDFSVDGVVSHTYRLPPEEE